MSTKRNIHVLEWGFRLLIVAFLALWVVYPPHRTGPQAPASTTARIGS